MKHTGRGLAVFVLFMVLWSLTVAAQTSTDTDSIIGEQMKLGREAMDRGDFRQAREYFALVLKLDWNNPLAYQWWVSSEENLNRRLRGLLRAGDREVKRGALAEALINYHAALRLDSTRADVKRRIRETGEKIYGQRYLLAGLQFYLQDDFTRMQAALDSVFYFDPDNPSALALQERTRAPGGLRAEQASLRDDAAVWELHLAALKKYRNGEYDTAIEQWEKILEKYPGNADVLANIEQARLRLTPDGDNPGHLAGEE